jgi:peptidoglycan hydrolase-like protein with peptidoglycan-binding domain
VPEVDLTSHEPWLESKRRSRARRAVARKARRLTRGRKAAAIVAALSLTVTAGGAVAAGGGGSSVRAAGSSVTALQSALGISADGVYGPQTRAAVKRFQRSHGLAVDGIAGPATLGALGISGRSVKSDDSSSGTGSASSALAAIARCESGGDPTAVSPSGQYRGKYQFSRSTWRELGGSGDPAAASEGAQDRIAAKLYAARGTAPWPVCGKSA